MRSTVHTCLKIIIALRRMTIERMHTAFHRISSAIKEGEKLSQINNNQYLTGLFVLHFIYDRGTIFLLLAPQRTGEDICLPGRWDGERIALGLMLLFSSFFILPSSLLGFLSNFTLLWGQYKEYYFI